MEGSCEHGKEFSSSIKYWEILEYLYNWRLLTKGSSPWSKCKKKKAVVTERNSNL
jgi:hypothetical protein